MKKQLLLALFIVAGLAAVLAFKQEPPKKYLTLNFYPQNWITIVDEKGGKETTDLKTILMKSDKWIEHHQSPLTVKLNELAAKGYKLVAIDGQHSIYIFEKE
ncbi:MAG: hypothetical protein WC150_09770 [Bacteroidia bacterium]